MHHAEQKLAHLGFVSLFQALTDRGLFYCGQYGNQSVMLTDIHFKEKHQQTFAVVLMTKQTRRPSH